MSKYLLRLIGFTFLLGAVPILIIGLFTYWISAAELQTKTRQTNMQLLNQTRSEVENILAKMDYGTLQFAGSPYVNQRLQSPLSEEEYEAYLDLSGMLSKLGAGNTGIRRLSLASLEHDWLIDGYRLNRLSAMADRESYLEYASLPNASSWLAGENGSLLLIRKLPLASSTSKSTGLLVAEIDMSEITRQLTGKNLFHASLVLDSDYRVLSSGARMPVDRDVLSSSLRQYLAPGGNEVNGYFQINGDRPAGVLFTRSPYTGWYFISAFSIRETTRDARALGSVTFAACAILLALTGAFVWIGSKKMYNPVKKLYELLNRLDRSGGETGRPIRDEFVVMEQSVARLVHSESAMRMQMNAVLPQVRELFALKLFTGQMRQDEILEKMRLLRLSPSWSSLAVLVLQFDPPEGSGERMDADWLMLAISRIVEELLPPEEALSPALLGRFQAVLLFLPEGASPDWKETLTRCGETIRDQVLERLHIRVTIGISRPFVSLGDAMKAYAEALEAWKSQIDLGAGIIAHYDEIAPPDRQPPAAYPEHLTRQLLDAVRLAHPEWADDWLHAFFRYLMDNNVSSGQTRYMLMQLLYHVLELVKDEPVFLRDLFGEQGALERLALPEAMEEKERWFKSGVLHPVIRHLAGRVEHQHDSIAKAALQMIHEHFGTELSLEICAAKLNFHPSHVSRVFKKEVGVAFSEYLAQYRLSLSKQWLKETDLKIGDIAAKLNYNSPAAFVRYFRNMEGITPGEYRKQYGTPQKSGKADNPKAGRLSALGSSPEGSAD